MRYKIHRKKVMLMVENNNCGCAKFQVGNLPEVSVCSDNIWEAILGAGILLGLAYIARQK
ncbi:MAG: hypothetical protein Q8O46_03560 [bacterium]|nr:hypothetical protein [bacterium]